MRHSDNSNGEITAVLLQMLAISALLVSGCTRLQENSNVAYVLIKPSDCVECGQDCLEPLLLLPTKDEGREGGSASANPLLTEEKPNACVRYDGRKEDLTLVVALDNKHTIEYRFSIQESGQEIYRAKVAPGARLEEDLTPQSSRRYTFRVSVKGASSEKFPARAGFLMIRGSQKDRSPASGISFVLMPMSSGN